MIAAQLQLSLITELRNGSASRERNESLDVFVLLPDVQFQRHSWQQRNRVRNGKDAIFLSVPVKKSGDLSRTIRQTEIADEPWRKKHLTTLKQVYGKRPHFDGYFPAIEALIEAVQSKSWDKTRERISVLEGLFEQSRLFRKPG